MFYRAWIFDKKGEHIGTKRYNGSKETFKYKDNVYTVDRKNSFYHENIWYWIFFKRRTTFYREGVPTPLKMVDGNLDDSINSKQLKIILETDTLEKLNNQWKKGLLDKIDIKVIGAILVIFLIIYSIAFKKPPA